MQSLLLALVVSPLAITHDLATEPVTSDADDPAIWHHPSDPMKSRIIGTDKVEGTGGLFVFDAEGKIVQKIQPLDRPNNVDVEQGVRFGEETWDIAVATERVKRRLAIYRIDRATGELTDVSGATAVFKDRQGDAGLPMGVSLYNRKSDGALIAAISAKAGPTNGYLETYRLTKNAEGKIDVNKLGSFGRFSGTSEIEAVFCDDAGKTVYYADEDAGFYQYGLDPMVPRAESSAFFGSEGFSGDREGIAMIGSSLLCSDQIPGGSKVHIFNSKALLGTKRIILTDADETDGLEATDKPFGRFAKGIVVMMNSKGKNFFIYDRTKFVP